MVPERSMTTLHPFGRLQFQRLKASLEEDTFFRVFETTRGAARQGLLYVDGKTKAQGWQSPHQYGLAVDFVPYINNRWTWDVPDEVWQLLSDRATKFGLRCDIRWDRAHVEHPIFDRVRSVLGL